MGVSWLAPLPPISPPSHRHPCLRSRSCGPGPEKRCMSPWQPITMQQGLQGYGPGCADVRAQGARKPARWHSAKQSRPAWGRPWGPAGRIAPPLARRRREPGVGWRSGVRHTLPTTKTRGPAPLASPGCPLRKGGRTGSSLGGSEQIDHCKEICKRTNKKKKIGSIFIRMMKNLNTGNNNP